MSNLYKSLVSSMRALSLAARPATTTTTLSAVQTRCLSQAILAKTAAPARTATPCCSSHAAPVAQSGIAVLQKTQARGMKVRSAIKKRCEHCKVNTQWRWDALGVGGEDGVGGWHGNNLGMVGD